MPARAHRSHRRRPRRSLLRLFAATTAGALILVAVLMLARARTAVVVEDGDAESAVLNQSFEENASTTDFEPSGTPRPNYRYSVIPGGVYDQLELRQAVERDPIVAAHYEHLDQSKLRVEKVLHDRYVHVSYRKGDDIFWTKKKVLLRQGETILTDGTTQVRARCGNCISDEPKLPTAADDPDTVEFDRLTDAPDGAATWNGESALGPMASITVPIVPTGVGARPGADSPDPLAAGRSSLGGAAPLPLAAVTPSGGSGGGEVPVDLPPDVPGFYGPLPGNDLFPPPPGTPTIPPGIDTPFLPPGGPPYVPPPVTTELPPPGEPGNPVPVPEPGTIFLVGGGIAAVIRKLRSRAS